MALVWPLDGVGQVGLGCHCHLCIGLEIATLVLARRLPRDEQQPTRKAILSVIGIVLAIFLLFDLVLVVESIAHIIWPNFVDSGT
jgi:hypothetical protein